MVQQVLVDLQVGDLVDQRIHSLGGVSRHPWSRRAGRAQKAQPGCRYLVCIRAGSGSEPGS
eukprot:scaffold98701_cov25-Phaeocystis_antarctica.AAC.1